MKTLVLDSNELARDLTCVSLRYQLIEHLGSTHWMQVFVPAVVFEECVANYQRAVTRALAATTVSDKERRRLGLHIIEPLTEEGYREYLAERFDYRLGFSVLPWPDIPHADLVARAVRRTPPFNENGGGYRDALVWFDVARLAREGRDVVLVSSDKRAFAGPDGELSQALTAEVADASGSVQLVPELGPWLLAALPQGADGLVQAVVDAQDQELYDYLVASDARDDMAPGIADFGFARSPWDVTLNEVDWLGTLARKSSVAGPDGLYVAEYELDFSVALSASFAPLDVRDDEWVTRSADELGRVVLEGELQMVLRIAVLFGGDVSFSIEEESWRRADGVGPGLDVYRPETDPLQPALFGPTYAR